MVPAALSPGVMRPDREADHSSPFSAEVMNVWRYISTPPSVFMAWYLVKHRDSFCLYLSSLIIVSNIHDVLTDPVGIPAALWIFVVVE
jgi:hypothetical protein